MNLVEQEDGYHVESNIHELLKAAGADHGYRMINSQILGRAFEPDQYFENPDGTSITFDKDYYGEHRGIDVLPGPFVNL